MRQKIALTAASLAATATLAIALSAAGLSPVAHVAPGPVAPVEAAVTTAPSPRVQVDTIYVAPAPTQATITIVQAPAGGEPGEGNEGSEGND